MSDVINGHFLRTYMDGVATSKATECSFELEKGTREISHKDTPGSGTGYKEFLPGEKSGTLSTSGLLAEGDSFESMWTAYDTDLEVDVLFSSEVTGDKAFSSKAIITSLSVNAPNNENVTYSANFQLTGAITRITV